MTCCATPEGTERQEEDVAQDLGGLQEYRRITPMALFALQAAADAGEPRVRLNPWRDWPPRRGSARRLRLHVAEHRLQAEQAGIAQGAQFVEADAGEDFHAAQRIGAQGLLQLAGTAGQGAGANGGSAALDGMQQYVALPWTSPRRAGVRAGRRGPACPERSAATPGRSAPGLPPNARRYRPAPRPVRPRPLPLPARPRRSCRDDRAGKAPGAPCRSASPHGRSCPPPGFAVGQRGVGGPGQDRQPGERPSARILRVASRPSISGICMSISTASNGTLASSTC